MIARFSNGNELLRYVPCAEPIAPEDDREIPLTWSKVIVKQGERYLLLYNFTRKQWESPGGGIEKGESPLQAAIREVMEETCQKVDHLVFRGVFKISLHNHNGRCEYGALYTAELEELLPFSVTTESDRIILWHPDEVLDDHFSELTRAVIALVEDQPI